MTSRYLADDDSDAFPSGDGSAEGSGIRWAHFLFLGSAVATEILYRYLRCELKLAIHCNRASVNLAVTTPIYAWKIFFLQNHQLKIQFLKTRDINLVPHIMAAVV